MLREPAHYFPLEKFMSESQIWNHTILQIEQPDMTDNFFSQGRKIEATPLAMYNFFTDRVKKHLHIVLTMSPIGDAFRNRLRMFPSLINCCTIDWFQVCIF